MSNATKQAPELPLAGIRILELGHTVMGPSCSMVLADLGADVIKVEPPEGDRTRANVGFGSALFPVFNRNKRSLCIDLKSEAGKAVFDKVVATADALLENFVTSKFAAETFESLCAKLERLNIPFGPLAKPGDLFDD